MLTFRKPLSVGYNNTFVTNSVGAESIICIRVEDLVDATDEMSISNNIISVDASGTIGAFANTGILCRLGNSDQYRLIDNHINFGTTNTEGIGIGLSSIGGQNLSTDHIVRHNDITGISTINDILTNPLGKCFHGLRVQGIDYCDNTVDQSITGFLFLGPNNINLRNNHINHHQIGIEISGVGGKIGLQYGHGNEWDVDPDACIQFAAAVYSSNPFLSEFAVPEGNILPWLPPNAKLNPDPSITNWFHTGSVPLDYCVPMLEPQPRQLTPYEKEIVLGTSNLSGIALWDLKRDVYTKLLIFPGLRPTGSPEEAFFNSSSSSTLASFGNVVQQIRNALTFTTTYQQALATYSSVVELAFINLELFDANMNYASTSNLTDAWFAQRDSLLQQAVVNAVAEAALVNTRKQQLSGTLQNVLNYNTAITTAQTCESAQKTIQEMRIRHLLGQPITQTLYQQALALAQLGESVVGRAANDAIDYLALCDQNLLQVFEGGQEDNQERAKQKLAPTEQLNVYPNPTNRLIEINFPENTGSLLQVYSGNGQKIKSFPIAPDMIKVSLDFEQNPTGIYLIVLSNHAGKVISTAKVSVLH